MSNEVFLSLGSNLGDRAYYIKEAIERLKMHPKVSIEKISSFYETEPVGCDGQPWYYNAAVKIDTELMPEELLAFTKRIENELGRVRVKRWGPRTIDIDILLFNGIERKKDVLTIPHPRMLERAFVLEPLNEIEPGLILPNGMTVAKFTENLEQLEKIYLVKNS